MREASLSTPCDRLLITVRRKAFSRERPEVADSAQNAAAQTDPSGTVKLLQRRRSERREWTFAVFLTSWSRTIGPRSLLFLEDRITAALPH